MKITLIGHLCLDFPADEIDDATERRGFEYGGIFYSVATLANFASPADRIIPVFGVGEADYDNLIDRLKNYPNVDRSGIYKISGPTNQVRVISQNGIEGRIECSTHFAPPIPFSRIEPFLNSNGVLVNMVSGFDITLETLDHIRMLIRDRGIPIHFDIHSLTLGVDDRSRRFGRPLTDWRRWCFMLNSIQLNQQEAAGLTAERYDEATLIKQVMSLMVQALVITRGKEGATVILQEHKKLSRHEIAPIETGSTVDPPGSGDVFGAVFFHHYLKSKSPIAAAELANRIAAWKSTFSGSEKLDSLQERLKNSLAL